MLTGQILWAGSLRRESGQGAAGSAALEENSELEFTQMLNRILEMSDAQISGAAELDGSTDTDLEGELLAAIAGVSSSSVSSLQTPDIDRLSVNGNFINGAYAFSTDPLHPISAVEFPRGATQSHAVSALPDSRASGTRSTYPPVPDQTGILFPQDVSVNSKSQSSGSLDKVQLSAWMDAHALSRSSHLCAQYCRMGLEAAGLDTSDRPRSGDAGDYGPFLLRHGAEVVSSRDYDPKVGDVVVFDKTAQHPNGHIEMFDGNRWISDFKQHGFSPYSDSNSTPTFTIYRLG